MADIYDRALLGAVEAVSGTDQVPTGTDVIRVNSFNISTDMATLDNKVVKITAGNLPHDIGKKMMTLEIEFKLRFSGALGTAPELSPILQCCALTETLDPAVDVEYAPSTIPASSKTSTFYAFKDGLRYNFVGSVGNLTMSATMGEYVICTATINAPYLAPTVVAVPSLTYSDAGSPIVFESADVFNDGSVIKVGSFEFDCGNEIIEHYVTGDHSFEVKDRAPTMTFSKDSVGTAAELAALAAGTDVSFSASFDGGTGNKLTFTAPVARRTSVGDAERGTRDTKDLAYNLYESAGDDQYLFNIAS
jgi:phage baseplate assembly protein gpV